MKKQTSQSTVRPDEWDTTSSQTVVYHNYDIVEVPATEDMPLMYNYNQDVYSRDEYLQYVTTDVATRISLAEAAILEIMDKEVV